MQPYDMKELEERVILVGVQESFSEDVEESLDELAELCETAGALVVGRVIQNREKIHPGTYVGKGKIEEIALLMEELGATGIVCDDELSPAQINNLEKELDCKIMDRTLIILDIFAARANTSEGNIQVELAQLRYRAARLVGLRNSLSRLGGGIGTRGPGYPAGSAFPPGRPPGHLWRPPGRPACATAFSHKIGRASCRERV